MMELGECTFSKPYVRKVVRHFGLRACSGIKTLYSVLRAVYSVFRALYSEVRALNNVFRAF